MKKNFVFWSNLCVLLFVLERYFTWYRPEAAYQLGFNPIWCRGAFYPVAGIFFIGLLRQYLKNDNFSLNTYETIQLFLVVCLSIAGVFLFDVPLFIVNTVVQLVAPLFR